MYATILVAADLAASDRTKELLARAQELCAPNGTIRLLHVLSGPASAKLRASAMASLLALSSATDPRVLPILREGKVAPQILAMANADRSDLILLAKSLPGLSDLVCKDPPTCDTHSTEISVLIAHQTIPERTSAHV